MHIGILYMVVGRRRKIAQKSAKKALSRRAKIRGTRKKGNFYYEGKNALSTE